MQSENAQEIEGLPGLIPLPVPRRGKKLLHIVTVSTGAAVVWLVTWLAVAQTIGIGTIALSMIIPSACVVLFTLIVLRQDQKWVSPVRRMNQMLPQIRAGDLHIDALNDIDGGLAILAGHVRTLFHDIRMQETKIAELDREMKQKVANRTDALERKIGSLHQQSVRDVLTGLFNRRMLDQYLPDAIAKCKREKANLSLLMIDVDYFKVLNDSLGHPAGDALLRNIGQIIRSTIREQDAAFRCGGDEFVVILPGCGQDNAEALAARLNSLVMALTSTYRLSHQPKLSIGVANIGQLREASAETLIAEADKRLYEIKSARKALDRNAPRARGIAKAG